MAVSSDSPITAAAPRARDAHGARLSPPPQIVATDGELLGQFTRQGDREALDRLVDRHSAMVWRVCRATLRRPQDVEDAFQATFLLLTKNARSIKSSDSAAGWLYRVAYRTSLRARKKLSLRREEALAVDPHAPSEAAFPDLLQKQTTGVLVEELMRLPAKYQTPLVLRYLEGQSRRAIADQTDTTIAGVQGRLARGKQLLRRRLLRRGVSLAAVMGALGLGTRGAAAAENAPARVVVQTTSNSVALATGGSVAASAGVLSLYQEGVRAMLAIWIGKPLASSAALVAAALLLLPPGEAGESRQGAASAAPAALQLEVGLETLAPAITPDKGAVELVQATPAPAPAAVLQADRIELSSQDNQFVQLRAEGDVQVTTPQTKATAVVDPGDPVPPADDRERLSRLLALREQLNELNQRQGEPGLPGGSPASKRLLGLLQKTNLAIGQITGKQITDELAVLEKELAVLTPTASRRRESSEGSLHNPDEPLKELGYAPVPGHIRARLRAMLADFSGVKIEVSDEQEGRFRASIAVPSSYVEAVHRLKHPDQPIDKEALRQTQDEVAAQIEEIAMPLLPRLAVGENEYKQVRVTVYTSIEAKDSVASGSGAKMKVKVGEPAELSIDTPDKNHRLRLRYEPASGGQTATVQLIDSSGQAEAQPDYLLEALLHDQGGPQLELATAKRLILETGADRLRLSEGQSQRAVRSFASLRNNTALQPNKQGFDRDATLFKTAAGGAWSNGPTDPSPARTRPLDPEVLIDAMRRGVDRMRQRADDAKTAGNEKGYRDAMRILRRSEDELDRLLEEKRSPLQLPAASESSEEPLGATPPTGVGSSPTRAPLQPVKSDKKPSEPAKAERPKWPVIVESVPEHGATDVDPDLTEVRVTFDRDMQRGMSWTGGRKSFMPETPPGAEARWIDKRTCVLPVHLKKGEFYRVGINAKSYQNFKSTAGVPAAHGAIAFSTKGAKRSVARRARTPKVVELSPATGEASVSPGVTKLRVTFDMKMGGGMSWTNTPAGPFPEAGGGRAAWSRDGRTCTLPVKLEAGKAYALGLNASHAVNFQSEYGVPLEPVLWEFTTGEALAANQYGPDSKMKQGQWNCHHKPSELNPKGWATIAELNPGEHAPVLLPNDERPRPHLRYDAWNQSAGEYTHHFTVEDPEGGDHGKFVESSAAAGGATSVRGQPIEVIGLSDPVENGPTLVLIRNRFDENPLPTIEEARRLLQSDPIARPVATRAPGRVDHTDGRADGKKSLGGSGHLIRFELPEGAVGVKSVRIHGSRYGTKTAPREDFEISFLSEDRSEILDVRHGAYGLFRRGAEKWTNVRFKDPVVELPETFWVAIDFNPGRTKGVYLSYDTSTGGERSMTGLAQQEPDEHKPVTFGGDWMVSVVLERADAASLVPPGEKTQPVAKTEESEGGDEAMVEPGIELLPNTDDETSFYAQKGREYGYSVSQLQRRLNEVLDPSPGLDVDDDYGPLTTRSVERFQRESGLAATGFADAETRDALGFIEPGAAAEEAAQAAKEMPPQEEQAVAKSGEAAQELLDALRATATYREAPPEVQKALEERLNKAVGEAANYDLAEGDRRFVVGRVALAEGDEPELVAAQMKILSGGYFLDLLGDKLRPVGFRRHGYEPVDLKPSTDEGTVADVGLIEMTRSPEMASRRLLAEFKDEAGEPVAATLKVRQMNGPINTPSNGYEPRPRFAPSVYEKGLDDGALSGFSPMAYRVTITAEGCVAQSKRIDFSEQDEIDLGEITLEKPKQVEMEYLIFRGATPVSPVVFSADAFKQPLRAKLKPGERFVADPENDPHRTRFELRQQGGKLTFRSGYGSFRAADLGAVSLGSVAGTTRTPVEQHSTPEIVDGHVYLLSLGPSACHVLLKARLVEEGSKASPAEEHLAEARASIEAAEKHLADAKRLHDRAAKSKSETVRRVLTKSSDQRLAAAMASLSNSGDHLELAGSRLVEQLGAGSKDLESRLGPIAELSERLGKLAKNNWLVQERPERLKTLIEQYDLP